ncbi:hypothetical protein ZHAS_00016789 [Anopheles sinensis]|uniref:Uncharacterized protein n=1 Tax=Anopheles sinensis TaxID=74873 RepID=A0A084WE70_ANOSI|nr:hypothetical protein ZHAS_00016789 [Anopheles sinensis]
MPQRTFSFSSVLRGHMICVDERTHKPSIAGASPERLAFRSLAVSHRVARKTSKPSPADAVTQFGMNPWLMAHLNA